MINRKKYIIMLSVLGILLILFCIIIYIESSGNSLEILLIGGNKESVEEVEEQENIVNNDGVSDKDSNISDAGVSDVNTNDSDTENNYLENVEIDTEVSDESVDNTYEYTENDVVEYFVVMEKEVSDSSSFKEKFKEYFITVVDFIFYDKEINGYTFSELSGTAKAKIISVALKIDSKIEEYVPNYKETISSTSSKVYTNVKEKLVTLYMDISTDICKNNKEECTKVKEIFSDIKDYCKIGWDFIKGLASSGVSKIKEWYEIYSGK